ESPVKIYADQHGIKTLQPTKLTDPVFLEEVKALEADFQIVVAFRMMPQVLWQMPPLGTLNLHGSLLPQYRGAAPINRAIMNGEQVTGITTFFLRQEIDTGQIIFRESLPISSDETAGELHDRMM
ncbi:MAG TPA: methionyl-tRNA formyltransferase, partial [Bacteroidia bacterium]|nr:methionyl-tRNA formyltransferase [Bacteroidia bacterium]